MSGFSTGPPQAAGHVPPPEMKQSHPRWHSGETPRSRLPNRRINLTPEIWIIRMNPQGRQKFTQGRFFHARPAEASQHGGALRCRHQAAERFQRRPLGFTRREAVKDALVSQAQQEHTSTPSVHINPLSQHHQENPNGALLPQGEQKTKAKAFRPAREDGAGGGQLITMKPCIYIAVCYFPSHFSPTISSTPQSDFVR